MLSDRTPLLHVALNGREVNYAGPSRDGMGRGGGGDWGVDQSVRRRPAWQEVLQHASRHRLADQPVALCVMAPVQASGKSIQSTCVSWDCLLVITLSWTVCQWPR